jgi:hypothetical protein
MTLRVISLGAGVQSTTLALMAMHGEFGPLPDCAIFADTQWEPKAVYAHLEWLDLQLPFPVHRVSLGNLKADLLAGKAKGFVPFYTTKGLGRRQCTKNYKLRPIFAQVRKLLGGTPKGGCEMWIGISSDEMIRMKDARVQYIVNRFPLVERRMNRNDCLRWLERQGYPTPPRSACLGCPFKRDSEWRETRKNEEEWQETIGVDLAIRARGKAQYMHRS